MKNDPIWYGFLEAGDKSTAVALDERLHTGNPKTLYLFNLVRGQILEYNREIVKPKLRELGRAESSLLEELKTAFDTARGRFEPRAARVLEIPDRPPPAATRKAPRVEEDELEVLADADPDEDDDSDWVEDDEEA